MQLPAGTLLVTLPGVNRATLALLCLLTLATPATGTRMDENYPKLLVYSSAIGQLPAATQDSLSWYDILVCYDRPEVIQSLRARNPGLRCLWSVQPQFATPPAGDNPWWMPDTLWSPSRLIQYYAQKNDWYLRDTAGQVITDGSSYVLNWTRHCPAGTFGSAKGLRAAEWVASRALPQIALSRRYWDAWSWDSGTAYNGFMFEILADCLGSYGWPLYTQADPDRDGVAEGVYSACSTSGSEDPLSLLMREENDVFYGLLEAAFPSDFVFLINENNEYIGPSWRTRLSGMKFENWMRSSNPSWHDWWDWFYGLTPPWAPTENWGAGYAWAESQFDGPVADGMKGWDLSFIQVWEEPTFSEDENLRQMRWGLGTAMLGDGYFTYTKDQKYPKWQREFDWDIGLPLGPFAREIESSADTLYVRLFERGMVEVNPYDRQVSGVPARDSRFTFWLPVTDLAAEPLDGSSLRAAWTAPEGEENEADSFELRHATAPITLENWDQATPYPGGPFAAAPGSGVSAILTGLQSGTRYHLAVRTRTRGRAEPILSNPCSVETPAVLDRTAPSAIIDLSPGASGQSWIQLTWTATGDDGTLGTASSYLLRYLPDGTIGSEEDWALALRAGGLPTPHASGFSESYFLTSLSAGRSYGIAVRAIDDAGALSPLHPPVHAQTASSPPPDEVAPSAIADLSATADGAGMLFLAWTAPGDDGTTGRAAAYAVRIRAELAIETEGEWEAATAPPAAPPTPSSSGSRETMRLASLIPGHSYGVAVRAMDEAGNVAPLSNPTLAAAGEDEPPPPPPPILDLTPPAAVADLTPAAIGDTFVVLQWTAPGDDGLWGTAALFELRLLAGGRITGETSWLDADPVAASLLPVPGAAGTAQTCRLNGLIPRQSYGAAVRARDEAGNLGGLAAGLLFETLGPAPPPPPSPPLPPNAVDDLRQAEAETTSVLLVWTAPSDAGARAVSRYQLRIAAEGTPDSALWTAGSDLAALPRPATPGAIDSFRVAGLIPSSRYGFILRSEDEEGTLSPPSNALWAITADPPPPPPPPPPPSAPAPPGPITDLALESLGEDSALVAWTAPGDDGSVGRAARYEARVRIGAPIESESDWLTSSIPDTAGLGRPLPAGTRQQWVLLGLVPETTYSIAIRAVDDSNLVSALSNPLQWTTAPPPPSMGPGVVLNIASLAQGTDWVDLAWTAPEAGLDGSSPTRYRLALRPGGHEIRSEDDWSGSEERSDGLPFPARSGERQSCRINGLDPSRCYAVSLRAEDQDGHRGSIAAGPVVMTLSSSLPTQPSGGLDSRPAPIADLAAAEVGASWVDLVWTAVGDDSLAGTADLYMMRARRGGPLAQDSEWTLAEAVEGPVPAPAAAGTAQAFRLTGLLPGSEYAIALRAVDPSGWVSPFAPGIQVRVIPYVPVPPPVPDPISAVEVGTTSALLQWVQVGSAGEPNGVASYTLAISTQPVDESTWPRLAKAPAPPRPTAAGELVTFRCENLEEATEYWAALRTRSPEGLVSSALAVARFATRPLDLAPPEPPSDLGIAGFPEDGQVLLRWIPSPSPTVAGYYVYGSSDGGDWTRIETEPLNAAATEARVPAESAAFAVSAVDRFGSEGTLCEPVYLAASRLVLRGPFPHPVTSSCRFEIDLPSDLLYSRISLKILDARGIEIRTLMNGAPGSGGFVETTWDRRDEEGRVAAAGFYLVLLDAGGRQLRRQIFLSP